MNRPCISVSRLRPSWRLAGEGFRSERGNVNVLLLVAIVLFAALFYSVTITSREQANDAYAEATLVNASLLTQFPSLVRARVTRVIVNGIPPERLDFSPNGRGHEAALEVFTPGGAGLVWLLPPRHVVQGEWVFTEENSFPGVGTADADIAGVLSGLGEGLCRKINESLVGFDQIPEVAGKGIIAGGNFEGDGVIPPGNPVTFKANDAVRKPAEKLSFSTDNQQFMCVDNDPSADVDFTYYHLIVER